MRKHKTNGFITLAFAIPLFIGGIVSLSIGSIHLKEAHTITGTVTDAGLTKISKIRLGQRRVFYFRLQNSDERFIIERRGGYTELRKNIRVGDTLRVFYTPGHRKSNFQTFQVEKNGRILYGIESFRKKYMDRAQTLFILGSIACIISIAFFTRRNKNTIPVS